MNKVYHIDLEMYDISTSVDGDIIHSNGEELVILETLDKSMMPLSLHFVPLEEGDQEFYSDDEFAWGLRKDIPIDVKRSFVKEYNERKVSLVCVDDRSNFTFLESE